VDALLDLNKPKIKVPRLSAEATSSGQPSQPANLPEPVQPDVIDSHEELMPDDDLHVQVQPGAVGPQPPDEVPEEEMGPPDVNVDRLLVDPTSFPMRMMEAEELKRRRIEFANQRRSHELADRPLHVMRQLGRPEPAPDASNYWVIDEKEDDVFGVIIDMPSDESEWKKALKNPAKFAAKAVSKGAEVAWHKLNATQRAAMAEAKQLEAS